MLAAVFRSSLNVKECCKLASRATGKTLPLSSVQSRDCLVCGKRSFADHYRYPRVATAGVNPLFHSILREPIRPAVGTE
jgi:hypothetical protein